MVLDNRNRDSKLIVNLDVAFPRIPCKFAKVTLWDYLGNSRLELEEGVRKFQLRGEGSLVAHEAFVDKDHVVDYGKLEEFKGKKFEEHSDGGFIEKLDKRNWEGMIKREEYALVLFYVDWCIFCQMLLPQWEILSRKVVEEEVSYVAVYAINCQKDGEICRNNFVTGYPTIKMFKEGKSFKREYDGPRTADAIYTYLIKTTGEDHHKNDKKINTRGFEGCFFHLRLNVNRVPGKLEFSAKSAGHSFNEMSTNASHRIHHLSFGPGLPPHALKRIPRDVLANIAPLDGHEFTNHVRHMSHEHYVKVVTTHYERGTLFGTQDILGYQMAVSNHMYPSDPNVPEAKFSFDLSPTAVVISQTGRRWYEFLTSLCGIIGGTFTVFTLLDRGVYAARRRLRKGTGTPTAKSL